MRIRFALFCFIVGLLTNPSVAQSNNNCSLETVKGDYGFVSSVRRAPPATAPARNAQTARFIGLISYDGSGNATVGGLTIFSGGQSSSYSDKGKYSIDATHCTGSVSFDKSNSSKWDFVIVDSGRELLTVIEGSEDTAPFSQKKR
jgi:hypothetical protein